MTKERLEELIKQGATVYYIRNYTVQRINLSDNEFCDYNIEHFYLAMNSRIPYMTVDTWDIKSLYETKEQAEWYTKTYTERTERFEPPMWEDIDKKYQFKFMWKDLIIRFAVLKFVNTIKIENDDDEYQETYFDEPATKENYEKACEIVRDLFKGEK